MVTSCAAWGCTNRQTSKRSVSQESREKDITFHRFPTKKPALLSKWVAAVRREHFVPTASHRLCSVHFVQDDFGDSVHRRILKSSAVPSVFSYPQHLQKSKTPRRKLERKSLQTVSPSMIAKKRTKATAPSVMLKGFRHDHTYARAKNTEKSLMEMRSTVTKLRAKVKLLINKAARRKKSVMRLSGIIKELRDKKLVETAAHEILEQACDTEMSLTLFRHLMHQRKTHKHARRYNSAVSKFAITLHYLSPKAYNFIRPTLHLPHPATLRAWKGSIDCSPGYFSAMLKTVEKHASTGDNVCSLIIDEMSLRKEVTWCPNSHTYRGHVDFGGGPINDTVASSALVFMVVSMKRHWKTPVAYFLTDHIDSERLASSIKEALMRTADHGLIVKTVVGDGLKANMKAARHLGCDIDAVSPRPYFSHPHPSFRDENVFFICDPPHMLKLFRNLLAEYGTVYRATPEGRLPISWKYVRALHELQVGDSVYLANKLRSKHIFYKNVKMKVNVAAQTLSSSVATAIEHLRDDLGLPQFLGSEETCRCIRLIDSLFDMLNSKNPVARGLKAPISASNRATWEKALPDAVQYMLSLQNALGKPLHQTPRGQTITGFVITAVSTLHLADDLLTRGVLRYLLTYKFSQDHLEMYFSKIRQRNGFNNNPTADQFRASLRTLMLQNDIRASDYANTIQQDGTHELQLESSLFKRQKKAKISVEITEDSDFLAAVDSLDAVFTLSDTDWRYSCIMYTAGFVSKRLAKQIKCADCKGALTTDSPPPNDLRYSFFRRRNNGGLVCPSDGIIQILVATEKAFRLLMPSPELMTTLPHGQNIDAPIQALVTSSLRDKYFTLFPTLEAHFFDHEHINEENHISQLIKMIVSYYLRMRLFKAGKLHQQRVILGGQSSKRIKLNKLVLFSGQ